MWKPKTQNISESTKLSAWRACVLCMFTCLGAQMLGLLTCLACLRASALSVLTSLVCLRSCVRACYDEMFYFLTCLRTLCAFFSYLLYISILKFKNSYNKKLVCFVKLNIFIYILIQTYKTIWIKFKGSSKVTFLNTIIFLDRWMKYCSFAFAC